MTGDATLRFSVIVPVYAQWHLMPALMERLAGQSLARDAFEIIVVDNGSPKVDEELVAAAGGRLIICTRPGSYAARNAGAALARGDWLAFTDADCLPRRDWLSAFLDAEKRHGASGLMAGSVVMRAAGPRPNSFEAYDIARGIPQQRYVSRGYAATANLLVPRQVFVRLGGFAEGRLSGGDAEFCRRAGAADVPIRFVPDAIVEHPARSDWEAIATKSRRVKGGQILNGSGLRRLAWIVRTLLPPLDAAWRMLRHADLPAPLRLVAIGVLARVWLVEIGETARLLAGGTPERR